MDRIKLFQAATDNGINYVRLEQLYHRNVQEAEEDPDFAALADDPRMQEIDLQFAVRSEVKRENKVIAYRYARAFMQDNAIQLEAIRKEINAKPNWRWPSIQRKTQQSIQDFSLRTHLPKLKVQFEDDNTISHPTISAQDKALFHRLFQERHPTVDALIKRNQAATTSEQAITVYAKNEQAHWETFVTRWTEENKGFEFSSLTNHTERGNYDAERGKAWSDKQPESDASLHP